MKENQKMIKWMGKVHNKLIKIEEQSIIFLLACDTFKGKIFYKNGDKYEGEFKNDLKNGIGKKSQKLINYYDLFYVK